MAKQRKDVDPPRLRGEMNRSFAPNQPSGVGGPSFYSRGFFMNKKPAPAEFNEIYKNELKNTFGMLQNYYNREDVKKKVGDFHANFNDHNIEIDVEAKTPKSQIAPAFVRHSSKHHHDERTAFGFDMPIYDGKDKTKGPTFAFKGYGTGDIYDVLAHETTHYMMGQLPQVFDYNRKVLSKYGLDKHFTGKTVQGRGLTQADNPERMGFYDEYYDFAEGDERIDNEFISDIYALRYRAKRMGIGDFYQGYKFTEDDINFLLSNSENEDLISRRVMFALGVNEIDEDISRYLSMNMAVKKYAPAIEYGNHRLQRLGYTREEIGKRNEQFLAERQEVEKLFKDIRKNMEKAGQLDEWRKLKRESLESTYRKLYEGSSNKDKVQTLKNLMNEIVHIDSPNDKNKNLA